MKSGILSCSQGLILIHKLQRPPSKIEKTYDKHLNLHIFKWKLKTKLEIPFTPICITSSFIGDLFVACADDLFTVWTRNVKSSLGYECQISYHIDNEAESEHAKEPLILGKSKKMINSEYKNPFLIAQMTLGN